MGTVTTWCDKCLEDTDHEVLEPVSAIGKCLDCGTINEIEDRTQIEDALASGPDGKDDITGR